MTTRTTPQSDLAVRARRPHDVCRQRYGAAAILDMAKTIHSTVCLFIYQERPTLMRSALEEKRYLKPMAFERDLGLTAEA